MVIAGGKLNKRWDAALARTRLAQLGIPPDKPVGKLSGGQRAQVALALALANGRGCCCSTSRSPASTRWLDGSSSSR